MKTISKKGNSIIEIMVVIVILTIGIVGAYSIISKGQNLAQTTEKRIQAINIAREGMEAVQNIRDTNWLLFSSDYTNCWNAREYSASCIGNSNSSTTYSSGSYILEQDTQNRWFLTGSTSTNSGVYLDVNGLATQSGSLPAVRCNGNTTSTGCLTPFTRTITLAYPASSTGSMNVTSTVTWSDTSSTKPHIIKLSTTLTNWMINK